MTDELFAEIEERHKFGINTRADVAALIAEVKEYWNHLEDGMQYALDENLNDY